MRMKWGMQIKPPEQQVSGTRVAQTSRAHIHRGLLARSAPLPRESSSRFPSASPLEAHPGLLSHQSRHPSLPWPGRSHPQMGLDVLPSVPIPVSFRGKPAAQRETGQPLELSSTPLVLLPDSPASCFPSEPQMLPPGFQWCLC